MKRSLGAIALLLAVMLLVAACGTEQTSPPPAEETPVKPAEEALVEPAEETPVEPAEEAPVEDEPAVGLDVGNIAPDFTVSLLDGTAVSLSGLRGATVFVNFWATWCGPCVGEMPHMQAVHTDYPDMYMLALSLDEGASDAAAFVEENGYTINVAFDGANDAAMLYNVSAIPTTLIIGPDGRILFTALGAMDEASMRAAVEEALASVG